MFANACIFGIHEFYTRFVQHASERDYIKIKPNAKNVCFSNVGRTYGMQVVSLGRSCNHVGTIVHELMHTIGK